MNKTSKLIVAIVLVAAIVAGAVVIARSDKADAPANNTPSADSHSESENTQDNSQSAAVTIRYTEDGFSPASTAVASGKTVRIVNDTDTEMEFASDPHPTHTINPELNTGDIEPGESTTITPSRKGSWGYHNHYDPSQKGTLVVE